MSNAMFCAAMSRATFPSTPHSAPPVDGCEPGEGAGLGWAIRDVPGVALDAHQQVLVVTVSYQATYTAEPSALTATEG